jgi:mono/diheme cytochrome c family protein
MMRQRVIARALLVSVAIGAAVCLFIPQAGRAQYPAAKPPLGSAAPAAAGHAHPPSDHKHDHGHGEDEAHEHPPVPPEYQRAHIPAFAWTDERMLSRGKAIHLERCAVCHGESGDGKGPAAVGLPLKPPDLRNAGMVNEMRGNYSFWRVSEGGAVEPFASKGSVMPAWKDVLSVEDRWAVIAYHHTFSSHTGPHVTSEHPEMAAEHHAGHGDMSGAPKAPASKPTTAPTTTPGGTGHRH